MLRFSLTSAVRHCFAHIDGLAQTTPKCSLFKDQKTGVLDESSSDMNTVICFASKVNFKEYMCAISWKRLNNNFVEAPIMFTTTAYEEEKCLAILQNKGSCVNYGDICFLNPYHDNNSRYMDMM